MPVRKAHISPCIIPYSIAFLSRGLGRVFEKSDSRFKSGGYLHTQRSCPRPLNTPIHLTKQYNTQPKNPHAPYKACNPPNGQTTRRPKHPPRQHNYIQRLRRRQHRRPRTRTNRELPPSLLTASSVRDNFSPIRICRRPIHLRKITCSPIIRIGCQERPDENNHPSGAGERYTSLQSTVQKEVC